MAIPSWPSTLPQSPQRGFSEVLGTNILRTSMDMGPAKMRYRGRRPDQLSVQFLLTTNQVATLQTFTQNTLLGVRRFSFTHPRKGTVEEVRIIPQQDGALFNIQYTAPGYYTVSLQLEVLP